MGGEDFEGTEEEGETCRGGKERIMEELKEERGRRRKDEGGREKRE